MKHNVEKGPDLFEVTRMLWAIKYCIFWLVNFIDLQIVAVDLGVSLLLVLENWRRGINDENFSHATLWGKKKMGKNWRRGGLVNRQVFPRPILLQEFVVRISFLSHSTTNTFICVYVYFFSNFTGSSNTFSPLPKWLLQKKKEVPWP